MRKRKWIIVLAFMGTVLVLGGYVGWRATEANDKIKQILLDKVRPFLAQESNVEYLEIDLSSIHLKGVRLTPKDRSFTLMIDDVRVGYRFWNLFRYRFSPTKVAHDVVFIHPTLIIRNIIPKINGELNGEEWIHFSQWVEEMETVKRITVAEAEVIVEDSLGERTRLAHSLNGWLRSVPADSAEIRLSGKVFESQQNNLTIEGELNLFSGRPINMHIQLEESESPEELPFIFPGYVSIEAGKMRGEVNINANRPSSGFFEISESSFSFKYANLVFHDVHMSGMLEENDIILEGTVQDFNGSPLDISGTLFNMFEPQLDLSVRCSRFDIYNFFRMTDPGIRWPIEGEALCDFHLFGPLNNSTIKGNVTSTGLCAYGFDFNRFTTYITIQDSILYVDGSAGQDEGISVNLNGHIDFSDIHQLSSLKLDIRGNLLPSLPSWVQNKISYCEGQLEIQLTGELRELSGEAQGSVSVHSEGIDTLRFLPRLRYADRELSMQVDSNQDFQLNGSIQSPFHDSTKIEIEADGLATLARFLLNENRQHIVDHIEITSSFSWANGNWDISSTGVDRRREDFPRLFDLRLTPSGELSQDGKVNLEANYYGFSGRALSLSAEGAWINHVVSIDQCHIGDLIFIKGKYPLHSEEQVEAFVEFDRFDFSQLYDLFPRMRSYAGQLLGNMNVNGSWSEPTIDLDLDLREGQFHDMGVFEGHLQLRMEDRYLRLCDLSLKKDGVSLLSGKVEDAGNDSLFGGFVGEDIRIDDLIQGLTGRSFISGQTTAHIQVEGPVEAPIVSGIATVKDGFLGSVSFQNLKVQVVDTLLSTNGILDHTLTVEDGLLERDDGFHLLFWGDFPYQKNNDMDISIQAYGNILGILPELSGLFRKAEGSGEAFIRLAGGLDDWVLGSGNLSLDQGRIEFSSFVKKVEKLQIQANLQQEDRFVAIEKLSGEVEGQPFVMNNRLVETGSNSLEPLIWDKMGVQFGVLQLTTEGKGVRVHLPGLMEEGEEGWIVFGQREPEQAFIFVGPNESPLFRGSLILTDNRLTYPFLTVEGDSSENQIVNFLERVNWDISILPREDVHFERDIESAVGNVYADLKLQDNYGELYLEGIIQDDDFQVWGNLVSTDGSVEVLDHFFQPERITFDYPRGADNPIVSGRLYTTVVDSLGMSSTIWLTVTSTDEVTGLEREMGPWDRVQFRFSTDNPNLGRSEADLLAALGYSAQDFKDRAYDALGMRVENLVFRPIFRPLEREIRRHLGLDVVRLFSMFSRNIVQLQTMDNVSFDPRLLLRSAKLILGKNIAPGLFLTYSGQVQNEMYLQYLTHGLGFRHALSLEYTIRPDLYLQMEYTYDSQLLSDRREDKRIWLRHIFSL
ncbi:translocation/assembly module TamB domain-containing protein [bacterium]|nr:translocation/assembly module TamB domain-containing protein [bacterium]RQV99151.1 MAG: hypothetical protein EH221_00790 [bacterium]